MTTKKPPKEQTATPPAKAGTRASTVKKSVKSNSVAPENDKVPEFSQIHPDNVKSTGKEVASGVKKAGAKTVGAKGRAGAKAKTTGNARTRTREQMIAEAEKAIDALLDEIAGGKSMVRACAMPGMPNRTAFLNRVAEDPVLQKRYEIAMQARADVLAEQTIDIADDGSNDTYLDEDGNKKTDHDVVSRSKLRVAARQWYIAKVAPKKYGDKVDLNHGGQADNPLVALLGKLSGSSLPIASNLPDDEDDAQ